MPVHFKKKLSTDDLRRFEHALGFHELGMDREALQSLQEMSSETDGELPVVLLQGQILISLHQFEKAVLLLAPAVAANPCHPELIVLLAYATRRAQSLNEAYAILEKAVQLFPREAIIQYNFACYCAQRGEEKNALAFLRKAVKLDGQTAQLAQNDEDFQPLRNNPDFAKILQSGPGKTRFPGNCPQGEEETEIPDTA